MKYACIYAESVNTSAFQSHKIRAVDKVFVTKNLLNGQV